jgi:hypothetical protein
MWFVHCPVPPISRVSRRHPRTRGQPGAAIERDGNRGPTRMHAELLEDVLQMLPHGARRDHERRRDLLVRLSLRHEREDLALASCQQVYRSKKLLPGAVPLVRPTQVRIEEAEDLSLARGPKSTLPGGVSECRPSGRQRHRLLG